MPAVFVHGVPETHRVWAPLFRHLADPHPVALRLPGFGAPAPDGFAATKEDYLDWLIAELERLSAHGPVDLVGHDWGGAFVVRAVSTRPELVRSWVTDAAGVGDPDFEWHEFAKLWQTPDAGEDFFDHQLALAPEQRSGLFESLGVPHEEALEMGGWSDRAMADAILTLYRSAVDVGREWGPAFRDIGSPGLVLVPSDDPFLGAEGARLAAQRAGAAVVDLCGLGHWWMLQDPARSSQILETFWSSLSDAGSATGSS